MTVTKKDLQVIIPFLLFIVIGIYGAFSVGFIIRDKPLATTLKWCGVPAFLFAVYYAYRATFGYPDNVAVWRNILGMIGFTAICSLMFFVAFEGFLIMYNCNIGEQKDYILNGQVTKVKAIKNKSGKVSYAIEVLRDIEKDTIKLDIPFNEYSEGQLFSKRMKVGSLGFIYSNN